MLLVSYQSRNTFFQWLPRCQFIWKYILKGTEEHSETSTFVNNGFQIYHKKNCFYYTVKSNFSSFSVLFYMLVNALEEFSKAIKASI